MPRRRPVPKQRVRGERVLLRLSKDAKATLDEAASWEEQALQSFCAQSIITRAREVVARKRAFLASQP